MYARTYRRALALLVAALGMVAATTLVPAPAQAAPLCSITYSVFDWDAGETYPAGFQASFVLTNNTSTRTVGWRVEVHYRAGVELTQNWNSVVLLDADPVYVLGNGSWNGVIAPNGGEQEFGLIARKSANNISNHPRSAVCSPIF
nr:cellulose binding domain-containing protein [Micromonospora sp. DSM 115978]